MGVDLTKPKVVALILFTALGVAALGYVVSDDVLFEGLRAGSETHFNAFYERYFPRPQGAIAGEWTPRYMNVPGVVEAMKTLAPDTKLVVLLRDPVERFRSGRTLAELSAADGHAVVAGETKSRRSFPLEAPLQPEHGGAGWSVDIDAWDAAYLCREVASRCSDPKPVVLPLILGIGDYLYLLRIDPSGGVTIGREREKRIVRNVAAW